MCKHIAYSMFAVALFLTPAGFVKAQAPQVKTGGVTITTIRGSGNSVISSSDGQGSVKVITSDQGVGNSVIVTHNGKVVSPVKLSFAGKDNKFWSQKQWHAELRMMLYWSPSAKTWFRYHADRDAYLPAVELYEHQARRAEREAMQAVDRLLKELDID